MLDDASFSDHALMQDPAFADALCLCGQHPVMLANGMTLLRRRLMGVPVAMLPRAAPPADLRDMLAQAGLAKTPLILSPDMRCALPRALRLRAPQLFCRLSLSAEASTQHARLHPKWRNQLTKAGRCGVQIKHLPLSADPDHPVLLGEAKQARAKGYANWPAALTAAFAAVAPEQTHLFRAEHNGQPVAHMLFLSHGRRVSYHIGLTEDAGKKVCAHNLLLWHAMRYFAERGKTEMELGLLDPRTPSLNRFKQRTGAQATPTGGTWLTWRPLARRPSVF